MYYVICAQSATKEGELKLVIRVNKTRLELLVEIARELIKSQGPSCMSYREDQTAFKADAILTELEKKAPSVRDRLNSMGRK